MNRLRSSRRAVIVACFASAYLIACVHQVREQGLDSSPVAIDALVIGTEDPHADMLRLDTFPSARLCANCHPKIFEEWRSSSHAYAGLSPMFHKFEQTLNDLASGTVGVFCVRCHLPVGTEAGQPREMTLYERAHDTERFVDPYVSIEGVTCIACHRVSEQYGRVNGQRRIERGTAFEPIYGTRDGALIDSVKAGGLVSNDESEYQATSGEKSPIHSAVHTMSTLSKSEFCMSCHQVAVHPGIKLEIVWDQYLDSPAHDKDVTCQDCHMGKTPGKWIEGDNYAVSWRAKVNNVDEIYADADVQTVRNADGTTEQVKGVLHKDHSFVGPGYSIAHPGIFPHSLQPLRHVTGQLGVDGEVVTIEEWMTFDWRSEWGQPEFERDVRDGLASASFPEAWSESNDRIAGRRRIEENLAELAKRKIRRRDVMEIGSHIDGPFFKSDPRVGKKLRFRYDVTNTCEGHNLPSGSLGAQPQVWLNVALLDPDGRRVWESGYVDDNGDLADLHSKQVLARDPAVPHDDQLFNLQSKFLTTNVKGTDREMYLPVNLDFDQIPFIRPAGVPSTVLNHPPFIRMEQHSIPPLKTRAAKYSVPASALSKPGTYKLAVRMRSRAEPIYFMDFVKSSEAMMHRMNERMVDVHFYTASFEVR